MALSQKLEFRQSHALVMTPQLMQAIKLLQLSNLDLAAYVEGELERNPLLERPGETDAERRAADPEATPSETAAADWSEGERAPGGSADERPASGLDDVPPDDAPAAAARAGADALPGYSEWAGASGGRREDGDYNLEAFVSAETTLVDHLAEQLTLAIADPARRMIGQYLIDMVDEAGYLAGDLATVADKLGTVPEEVAAVLAIVQTFDPPGVCARNLAECLALQLKERDRFDPAMATLVGHLDLLAKRDLAGLRRLCGVSEEDLSDMIGEIRQLNPKPGLAFAPLWCSRSCRTCSCARRPTAASRSSSIPTRCRRCWSTRPTTRRSPAPPRATKTRPIWRTACRPRPGSCARSTSAPRPSSKCRARSYASRMRSSPMESSTCARSTSRPWPTRSVCMNRRSRASPPTNTWRPAAASSN